MSAFKWIDIEDGLPDFGVPVIVHSHDKDWVPGTAKRVCRAGGGWEWEPVPFTDGDTLVGLQFWATIPPLPHKLRYMRDTATEEGQP